MKLTKLLPILLFVLISSCNKDEETKLISTPTAAAPASPILSLEKTDFKQFEIVEISVQNLDLQSEVYIANLGTETVELKELENKLYFITPDIQAGAYSLEAIIDGVNYSFNMNIQALAVIPSPQSYIQEIKDSIFLIETADSILARLNKLNPSPDHQSNYNSYNKLLAEFNAQEALLTSQEKIALAKFFKANEEIFTYRSPEIILDSLNMTKSALGRLDNYIESRVNQGKISLKLAALSLFTGGYALTFCSSSGFTAWPSCAIAVAALGNGYRILWKFNSQIQAELDRTFMLMDTDVSEMNLKNFQLENTKTYRLKIRGERRTLYNADINTTIPVLASFLRVCDTAEVYWNNARTLVNNAASYFTNDYNLIGNFPHPKRLTSFKSQWIPETPGYFEVGAISNSNVKLKKQTVVNKHLEVTFENLDTADQTFNFDLDYFDQVSRLSKSIRATIEGKDPNGPSLIGNWDLVERNIRNQSYYPGNSGDWYYDIGSTASFGNCTIPVFDFQYKDLYVSIEFKLNGSMIYSDAIQEHSRTYTPDFVACEITSYGPWGNISTSFYSQNYTFQVISPTQLYLVEQGQTQGDYFNYSLSATQFILYIDVNEYLVFEK